MKDEQLEQFIDNWKKRRPREFIVLACFEMLQVGLFTGLYFWKPAYLIPFLSLPFGQIILLFFGIWQVVGFVSWFFVPDRWWLVFIKLKFVVAATLLTFAITQILTLVSHAGLPVIQFLPPVISLVMFVAAIYFVFRWSNVTILKLVKWSLFGWFGVMPLVLFYLVRAIEIIGQQYMQAHPGIY